MKTDLDTATCDLAGLSLSELVDHIIATHHAYLRHELPRLDALLKAAARQQPEQGVLLEAIRAVFDPFHAAMIAHLNKEEQVIFPMIRQLDYALDHPGAYCGGITTGTREMEHDHAAADNAIATLRTLTNNYQAPANACHPLREFIHAVKTLEADMQNHTHKEDEVLIPRARAARAALKSGVRSTPD